MIQSIINILYRIPLSNYKKIKRLGGFYSYHKMTLGMKKMQKASKGIPPILSATNGLPIYFLTGKNYLYQTLFCAYSLSKASKEQFQFTLVDDGSFDEEIINRIHNQMPGTKIITKEMIEINLSKLVLKEKYPYLYNKRKVYPHIKKLTDVHSVSDNSYKLVLDSDMLFWRDPADLIKWLKNPSGCLHMIDCEESYGYTAGLMKELSGADIPEKVNVGAIGLNSNNINWEALNLWVKKLEEKEGTSYFLEQALSAMIIAKQPSKTILDSKDYIVNPERMQHEDILHHYVDLSKKYYFEKAWKKLLGNNVLSKQN